MNSNNNKGHFRNSMLNSINHFNGSSTIEKYKIRKLPFTGMKRLKSKIWKMKPNVVCCNTKLPLCSSISYRCSLNYAAC